MIKFYGEGEAGFMDLAYEVLIHYKNAQARGFTRQQDCYLNLLIWMEGARQRAKHQTKTAGLQELSSEKIHMLFVNFYNRVCQQGLGIKTDDMLGIKFQITKLEERRIQTDWITPYRPEVNVWPSQPQAASRFLYGLGLTMKAAHADQTKTSEDLEALMAKAEAYRMDVWNHEWLKMGEWKQKRGYDGYVHFYSNDSLKRRRNFANVSVRNDRDGNPIAVRSSEGSRPTSPNQSDSRRAEAAAESADSKEANMQVEDENSKISIRLAQKNLVQDHQKIEQEMPGTQPPPQKPSEIIVIPNKDMPIDKNQ